MNFIIPLLIVNILSNLNLVYSTLTLTEQQQIINDINQVRRDINPTGANLREIRWNDCLAVIADEYLQMCPNFGVLNSARTKEAIAAGCVSSGVEVGETIYNSASDGTRNPVYIWANQNASYTYSDNTCSSNCDNYLQLVNAETYLVGCAKIEEDDCGREGESILCDYVVASDQNSPYIQGTQCSSCEVEWSGCNDGLCTQTHVTTMGPTLTTLTPVYTTNPSNGATTYFIIKILLIVATISIILSSL